MLIALMTVFAHSAYVALRLCVSAKHVLWWEHGRCEFEVLVVVLLGEAAEDDSFDLDMCVACEAGDGRSVSWLAVCAAGTLTFVHTCL